MTIVNFPQTPERQERLAEEHRHSTVGTLESFTAYELVNAHHILHWLLCQQLRELLEMRQKQEHT